MLQGEKCGMVSIRLQLKQSKHGSARSIGTVLHIRYKSLLYLLLDAMRSLAYDAAC